MFEIHNLVKGWSYKEGSYRAWTKMVEIDEISFQLSKDGDAYDFAAYSCISKHNGHIYLEHQVKDIKLKVRKPQFINEMIYMEGSEDESVEGFDDSGDERTTTLTNGVEVNPPPNGSKIVAHVGLICSSQDKIEDDEYVSDALGSPNLDESDDDKGKRLNFENIKKNKLNKNYHFKWGMKFNSLADLEMQIVSG